MEGLLTAAKNLREAILNAVKERKAARPVRTEALNSFSACSRKYTVLIQHRGQPPALETRFAAENEMELLAPIAEEAADLLARGDFNLVRQCKHESCILWFLEEHNTCRQVIVDIKVIVSWNSRSWLRRRFGFR